MKDKLTKRKGFTIIEVVIVLAIAALIITIILLAVAALQRSQRDNTSKQAAGRLVAAFQTYVSDNDGSVTGATAIPANYITKINNGAGVGPTNSGGTATKAVWYYSAGGTCVSPGVLTAGAATATSNIAISYFSESGNTAVCLTN